VLGLASASPVGYITPDAAIGLGRRSRAPKSGRGTTRPCGSPDARGIPKTYSFLQQFAELVGSQLTVSEDSVEQTGADDLARVHRHAPAILVTQKVMAAFNAKNAKTYPFEGANEAVTGLIIRTSS